MDLLTFRIENEDYAVPLAAVRKVLPGLIILRHAALRVDCVLEIITPEAGAILPVDGSEWFEAEVVNGDRLVHLLEAA